VANTLLTDQHITSEALMILENNLTFTKQINRQYAKEYTGPTHRGATIFAKKPPRYTVRDGQNVSIQDTLITQTPITLSHQYGVDIQFTSQELTLSIDGFSEQILQPAMTAIANQIDYAGLALALQVSNTVGTPGTTPGSGATAAQTLGIFTQAGALLDKTGTPRDDKRAVVINEDAQATVIPALSGLFQDSSSVADQYKSGTMGKALGFKFSMSQNVNTYTTGAQGGTPLINGTITAQTSPAGTSLSSSSTTYNVPTKGWTASTNTLKAGDVVTFATCYAVNPVSGATLSNLKQFVLASDFTADGSGNGNLVVTEPMITSGAYKTVSNVPANNSAVNIVTSPASKVSPLNVAFHRDAFTLATVDLPLPGGVHMAARKADDQLGISLRFVAAYNVSNDLFVGRFDVLAGHAVLRPEWACRIQG
jgi:P22 coat protein - gene protein 5